MAKKTKMPAAIANSKMPSFIKAKVARKASKKTKK
jgi:hypothetical protein